MTDQPSVQVGSLLDGFCGGAFGRDSYGTERVEAIGADWIVVRDVDTGEPEWCGGFGRDVAADLAEYVI